MAAPDSRFENAALRERVKELEAQLSREQESVNELSIALQDAEKRVKELEELRRATIENE
jgi:cell division septum initiation protein DivIVA